MLLYKDCAKATHTRVTGYRHVLQAHNIFFVFFQVKTKRLRRLVGVKRDLKKKTGGTRDYVCVIDISGL
jgi:anthranilate phosphoribosyltransferase